MVASGVASKGLDFNEIQHVIVRLFHPSLWFLGLLIFWGRKNRTIRCQRRLRTTSIRSVVPVVQARPESPLRSSTCRRRSRRCWISSICSWKRNRGLSLAFSFAHEKNKKNPMLIPLFWGFRSESLLSWQRWKTQTRVMRARAVRCVAGWVTLRATVPSSKTPSEGKRPNTTGTMGVGTERVFIWLYGCWAIDLFNHKNRKQTV